MNYKKFKPSQELQSFVKFYWDLKGEKSNTPVKNTIIPDGTMKLIFHYGDLYWHHPENKESFLQPRCFLIGQLTKPYVVEPEGVTGSFVVRFHPNGFLPFTSIPIKDMENRPVPLQKLFGDEGVVLEKKILNGVDARDRISIIEEFLLNMLKKEQVIDRIVASAVETISTHNGQLSINDLTQEMNHSRRFLARKFSSNVGLSPKQLSKIIRLQTALKKMLEGNNDNLTDLAYDNEYFDQAHFIKDFKEFTGLTPKEFYGDHLKMSLLFEDDDYE